MSFEYISLLLVLMSFTSVLSRNFIFVDQVMTYDQANAYCASEYQSQLASIRNPGENAAILALCGSDTTCWIGFNIKSGSAYSWEDQYDIPAMYTNWDVNEPVCLYRV